MDRNTPLRMGIAAYHLLVIVVAVFAVVVGYRRGLLRQVSALLAIAFGIVCVRAFSQEVAEDIAGSVARHVNGFNVRFAILSLAAAIVYTAVYLVTRLITFPLAWLMKLIPTGILNSLAGVVLCLFNFLMFVSLGYNLIVDINPRSELLKAANQHDGNVVEGVMMIAPAVLGFPSPEEVGYSLQLEDAKKIS